VFRAVFDTNVYISAACFPRGGPPAEAYMLAIRGRFELWTTPAILLETALKLESKFSWGPNELRRLIKQIGRIAKLAAAEIELDAVKADPADNRILECAVAANVHFVVTGDKHLLALGQHNNILIVTPAVFVGLIAKS
jgi:uncharacterized protein